jgi:dihydrofolate synthase/folylpolyglutamate synthase
MRRTLADWLEYQQRIHPHAMDFTLGRIRTVLDRLGLLRPRATVVTVAGTNGKGSTTAMLDAVLRAGGQRVGLYTSPHLVRYEERIRIDGREIRPERLVDAFERIEIARGDVTLTFFEYATAAALLAFADEGVDAMVLEVGLGGRLDAVNAIDPDVAVVVSIGLDHCEYLGTTLEQIGREKAGIFRGGRPAIFGSLEMPESIATRAAETGARLERLGRDFFAERSTGGASSSHAQPGAGTAADAGAATDAEQGADATWTWRRGAKRLESLPAPALQGEVQYSNAATALAALDSIGALPARDAVAAGLRDVRLAGRFQRIDGPVEWIFDVSHNAHAAAVLARNVSSSPTRGRTWWIVGILRDKDAAAIVRELVRAVRPDDAWCAVGLTGERGTTAADLGRVLERELGRPVSTAEDVQAGCAWAASHAVPGDRILVFGSFHTVGPALEWHRLYSAAPR